MKYIIANLKAHQNLGEAITWIHKFVNTVRSSLDIQNKLKTDQTQVILAPSTPFLLLFKSSVQEFGNIKVAAQDISQFVSGSYTGESGSHALAGVVTHCIIGHSERRKYNNETSDDVRKKVENALQAGIMPILCVRSLEDMMSLEHGMVAYEPPDAIGTGKNYPIETVVEFKHSLQLSQGVPYLYGGSVDEQNERLYIHSGEVDGLLVGGASLDASRFCEMISQI